MRDLPWSLHTTSAPLGHKGVSDAKQIRDAGGIKLLHICPATGNLPTRMTRAAWDVLCAATQRKARERECIDKNQQYLMRMTKRLNVCAWCQGKTLPRGLEFIDAAEMAAMIKPKEEAMAKQSKIGVCENCGDRGALTGSFGRRVCSTCLKIRSNVNSHLEKVATAARDIGKGQELLAALVPDGGGLAIKVTADLLQDIAGICDYQGEDPEELVAAVRKATTLGAHQLTSEAEVGALRTIAGIVGYEGTDGELLVEAVRKRVLACASCEAEDVLVEIREIVGYTDPRGDLGLPAAVRGAIATKKATALDCGDCDLAGCFNELAELVDQRGASAGQVVGAVRGLLNEPWPPSGSDQHRVDLLRACGLELDDAVSASSRKDWSWAAAAAVQEIAHLTDRREFWASAATKIKVKAGDLKSELLAKRGEIEELRSHIAIGESQLEKLRAELTLAQQARDEWEQRCAAAEESMLDVEVELHKRDELARTGAEVERLRDRAQESESRLIWYREALEVLRDRLGLDHLGDDEDVVERMLEAIASQAQAMTRFQEMARTADLRADEVEAELAQARSEIEGLRDKLAVAEAGAAQKLWEPEPAATVPTSTWGDERGPRPADRRVLRVEVAVSFQGVRP